MDQALTLIHELTTLVGVHGAFYFDEQGVIRSSSTVLNLAEDRAVALARMLSRTLNGLSTVQRSNLVDIDLVFDEGRLVVKGLAQGGLCILCDRKVNYSLLHITLEQGLKSLRKANLSEAVKQAPTSVPALKAIAHEILGEHAPKVLSILDGAGASREELMQAIAQAEKVTRMFIDRDQAGQMAGRMRDLVDKSS
jgi:hypothetical protein